MMKDTMMPIRIFGYYCVILCILGGVIYLFEARERSIEFNFKLFVGVNFIFHLFLGVGIFSKNKWAYYGIRVYLLILAFGFPIGTIFALKGFDYLKKYNIRQYFV